MKARFEGEFLARLMEVWPNPNTGEPGITVYFLSKNIGVSQATIHTWLEPRNEESSDKKQKSEPSLENLRRLDRYFRIIEFVPDGNHRIQNDQVFENLKAFLQEHTSKKA